MHLKSEELKVIMAFVEGKKCLHKHLFSTGTKLYLKYIDVFERRDALAKYIADTVEEIRAGNTVTKCAPTNNAKTVEAWMEGREAVNKTNTLWTDGTTLWSYGLRIATYNARTDLFEFIDEAPNVNIKRHLTLALEALNG